MKLHVEKWGVGYAVFEGRKRVSGVYNCRDRAMTRLENIETEARQAAHARSRPCLTCGAEFWSTGFGNRMCGGCRARGSALDNRMLG